MGLYKEHENEILTLQLISQILGKIKLEYASQEPQWAHVMLDITICGFSTGLLKYDSYYFEIEVNLIKDVIVIKTKEKDINIELVDGKSISEYYDEIINALLKVGLQLSIYTKPQEMETKVSFEDDTDHHHYNKNVSEEILTWFQFALDIQKQFIAPLRVRKIYPGLFWGTFDVACIVIYNEFEPFPDDSKVIERAAFDEHMIEVGFWLGDNDFEHPTFFTLPYPFVKDVKLKVDDSFPTESYFSCDMAEYLYEIKNNDYNTEEVIRFMNASFEKSMKYLKWKNTDHYFVELKMEKNNK